MSNINDVEKYTVVRECPIAGGKLPVNSEIHLVHGCVYYNGGLMDTFYQREILGLIAREKKKPQYLRKISNSYY